ncbi:MAG TPA: DMT family transporter [candidate division Zixibacteria bacterium]|nr:DMT family transporter [candidate division Zixibacteria bacterium]MDD4918648.1 DMT family transporter [candidate division Zixibacteria bacterium]MDM7971738.1 DMT family transporter [candidate division Zixibacteria bacterium]HOD67153.1 DMT family transporter [candidate division Zixibacteria bacterium]HPM38472.1 DMT family transporter [candidate division Zixibacteria bacterium]
MIDMPANYLGPALSLLTAIAWACAVILFKKSGETVHPIGLNLFKVLLAALLFVPTIGLSRETFFRSVPAGDYLLVLGSGALGIGIADTIFFFSLNAIGAGRFAVVDCLYSPFVIALSMLFLAERLALPQLAGVAMIISGVVSVTGESHADLPRARLVKGVLLGALAVACTATSLVAVKPLLERSPLLWVTEMRMIGGAAVLLVVLAFHPRRREIVRSVLSVHRWAYTLSGSFMGAYVSTLLWLAGMKLTQASIAAALNQTSNVFMFIFAALFLGERVTPMRTLGIILGVGGAFLVMFGR